MDQTPTPLDRPKNVPLQWSAHVHPEHERNGRWYIVGGVFTLACLVYAIFTGAWSFAVVMVLLAGVYVWLRKAPPVIGSIRIDEEGCTYNGKQYLWGQLRDFWLVKVPGYTELHIARRRGWTKILIQTGQIPPPDIRATLSQFLPERADQGEYLIDKIIRLCKL